MDQKAEHEIVRDDAGRAVIFWTSESGVEVKWYAQYDQEGKLIELRRTSPAVVDSMQGLWIYVFTGEGIPKKDAFLVKLKNNKYEAYIETEYTYQDRGQFAGWYEVCTKKGDSGRSHAYLSKGNVIKMNWEYFRPGQIELRRLNSGLEADESNEEIKPPSESVTLPNESDTLPYGPTPSGQHRLPLS